jgi:hypothetical protein
MEAGERGSTIPAQDREVNSVHKALQVLWERKMKPRTYHTGATLPRAKLTLKGKSKKRPKIPPKGVVQRKIKRRRVTG